MTTDNTTAPSHAPGSTSNQSPPQRPAGTEAGMAGRVDPSEIMRIGMGFWASKTLLSAVELELFTRLGSEAMTAAEIAEALGLHERTVPDFPDALVALRLLDREGDGSAAVYRNTDAGAAFLDKASPAYIGGILEMSNARLYRFWGDLTLALRTGEPQNEIKHTGKTMFEELYRDRSPVRRAPASPTSSQVMASRPGGRDSIRRNE